MSGSSKENNMKFDLVDLGIMGDETCGIFTMGHVDLNEFRAQCIKRQTLEYGLDPEEVDPCHDVQHLYYIDMPSTRHDDDSAFVEVYEDWFGAVPVTVATFSNGSHWTIHNELARQRKRDENSFKQQQEIWDLTQEREDALLQVRILKGHSARKEPLTNEELLEKMSQHLKEAKPLYDGLAQLERNEKLTKTLAEADNVIADLISMLNVQLFWNDADRMNGRISDMGLRGREAMIKMAIDKGNKYREENKGQETS